MKGLLIKDFKLMKGQRNFFIIIVAMAVGMAVFNYDTSFIIGYMTVIGSVFTLSTISYDEFDNGNAFLFTLPITRKNYVVEKYEFGLITGGVTWLFATTIAIIAGLIKNSILVKDIIMTASIILAILLMMLAVMLPVQFKFGGEMSRIVIFGAVGILFVIAFAVVKIAGLFGIDLVLMLDNLPTMSMEMPIAAALGIAIVGLILSCKISISILNQKEF